MGKALLVIKENGPPVWVMQPEPKALSRPLARRKREMSCTRFRRHGVRCFMGMHGNFGPATCRQPTRPA